MTSSSAYVERRPVPALGKESDMSIVTSRRTEAVAGTITGLLRFFSQSAYARQQGDPAINDFVVGNPHDMPLPGFVQSLQHWSTPRDPMWFAYKNSERPAQVAVAAALHARRGVTIDPADIVMTNGAFGGLSVLLQALTDPGDEVIFLTPPWFFYEPLIVAYGGQPVRVPVDRATFDLDVAAIAAAITPRTRAIIVNSPNNPTGRVYPPETLAALADVLRAASDRNGRTVYLLSDEAYHRIVYDGRVFHGPAEYYANTFIIYTYGKTLLTPGQRLGYIAMPPAMPDREALRDALFVTQFTVGYAFPNALLQHALGDLEQLTVDVVHLQARRDRMVGALRAMGYTLHVPEATFYLLPRSPWPDDEAFVALLAEHNVFCLPGAVVEMPGHFRVSLTASDEMIERGLPGFAAALAAAQG
jgi:aspartate aminotransferase